MNRKPGLAGTALALLVMVGLSALAWHLPSGARVAVHWDINGRPNGYASKEFALGVIPAVTLLLGVLFYVVPGLEPRRANLARSAGAYNAVWLVAIFVMVLVQATIVLSALGRQVEVDRLIPLGIGLLFLVIGAVLQGVRSNFFFGIRTPWTLSSEVSWQKTHVLGGRLFFALGVATIVGAFLGIAVPVAVVGALAVVVVTVPYSYFIWRADRKGPA